MKKRIIFILMCLTTVLCFISCLSTSEVTTKDQVKKAATKKIIDTEEYYENDGGAEYSIQIEIPSVNDKTLDINAKTFRETITNDFSTFSAMKIIDISSKDVVVNNYEEGLDNVVEGITSDYVVTQVNLASADYTVVTEIESMKNLCFISSHITDNRNGTLKGTFTGKFNKTEMQDESAANTVAKTLLKKLGIKLTDSGQKEFKAQSDASKIKIAEKTNNAISKMGYYSMATSTSENAEITEKLNELRSEKKIDWVDYCFNLIDFMETNYPLFTYKQAPAIRTDTDGTFSLQYSVSIFPNASTINTYYNFRDKIIEKTHSWDDISFYPAYRITFGFYNKTDQKLGASVWDYTGKDTFVGYRSDKMSYYKNNLSELLQPTFNGLNRDDCQGTYIQMDKLEVIEGDTFREIAPIQMITESEYDVLYNEITK